MRQPYTDAEIRKGLDLRDKGMPWKNIAETLGRNEKAVYSKFAKIRRGEQSAPTATKTPRKYVRKETTVAKVSPTGISTYRPMFALVGSHSEVTTALRELFS